ncbi:MAG: hypothetical protein BJ554DRAFT_5402, partial [Olpidium bornovanus]
MVIFTTKHTPWRLKPLPIPRAHYDKLLDLLRARCRERFCSVTRGRAVGKPYQRGGKKPLTITTTTVAIR